MNFTDIIIVILVFQSIITASFFHKIRKRIQILEETEE